MDDELARADKAYRNKVLAVCILVMAGSWLLVELGLPLAMGHLNRLGQDTAFLVIEIVLIVLFLGMIPFGLHLGRVGRKIVDHERFPPPGVKVIRDVQVLRGKKAHARGKLLVYSSRAIIVLAIAAALCVHYFMQALAAD